MLFTSMATLINIELHTFIKKSYFLFLDAKIPPNILFGKKLGTSRLLNSCENKTTCTFATFLYIALKIIQGGV